MLNLESRGCGHGTVAFGRSSLATPLARRTANEPTREVEMAAFAFAGRSDS